MGIGWSPELSLGDLVQGIGAIVTPVVVWQLGIWQERRRSLDAKRQAILQARHEIEANLGQRRLTRLNGFIMMAEGATEEDLAKYAPFMDAQLDLAIKAEYGYEQIYDLADRVFVAPLTAAWYDGGAPEDVLRARGLLGKMQAVDRALRQATSLAKNSPYQVTPRGPNEPASRKTVANLVEGMAPILAGAGEQFDEVLQMLEVATNPPRRRMSRSARQAVLKVCGALPW